MKVQGIDYPDEMLEVKPANSNLNEEYLMVKEWSFKDTKSSGSSEYPYLLLGDVDYDANNQYTWKYYGEDLEDQSGIAGQGKVANPKSLFRVHYTVIVGTKVYDSSYGVMYADVVMFESAFAGIARRLINRSFPESDLLGGAGFDANGDGDINGEVVAEIVFICRKKVPDAMDLERNPINW